jgi:uncharacterized RDD family membrane protein YckC
VTDYQADSPADPQARSHARAHGHPQGQFQDQLSEEYTIDTPENVSFGYEVAGIGSRFIAALIDHILLALLIFGLYIAVIVAIGTLADDPSAVDSGIETVGSSEDWIVGFIIAIYALLHFIIWSGYFMLFEWLWHGQSIGKRITRIRVVRSDGAPVSFVPVAVRNLVRIVDFLPVGYGVGVITMFCNRQSRRLGDFVAGTLVVKDQGELTLKALMASIPNAAPVKLRTEVPTESSGDDAPELTPDQDWSGIRRLTPADYELVQETLARYRSGNLDGSLLGRVATAIATKLERSPSSQLDGMKRAASADQAAFLDAVAAAYGRWVK